MEQYLNINDLSISIFLILKIATFDDGELKKSNDQINKVSWIVTAIVYNDTLYSLPKKDSSYVIRFNKKKKSKNGEYGRISISNTTRNLTSIFYCDVSKEAYYKISSLDDYELGWAWYNGNKHNIYKNNYYKAFKSAFNSVGKYKLLNDSLVFKGSETILYLKKVDI